MDENKENNMKFLFDVSTTMKVYNNKRYWIDKNIIPNMRIEASSISDAYEEFMNRVNNKTAVHISQNALRNPEPMYIDTQYGPIQVGVVFTGSTVLDDTKQYIDIWVEVLTIVDTEF